MKAKANGVSCVLSRHSRHSYRIPLPSSICVHLCSSVVPTPFPRVTHRRNSFVRSLTSRRSSIFHTTFRISSARDLSRPPQAAHWRNFSESSSSVIGLAGLPLPESARPETLRPPSSSTSVIVVILLKPPAPALGAAPKRPHGIIPAAPAQV